METTDEFRVIYNKRAGIESTNSGIKRRTGMARLRVRGKKSVFHTIIFKIAGWNILQAAKAGKMRKYVAGKMNKSVKPEVQNQNAGNLQSLITCVSSFVAHAWQKTGFTCTKVDNNNLLWYHQMKVAA